MDGLLSVLIVPGVEEWFFDDHEVLQVQHLWTDLVLYVTLWHLEEDMDSIRVWLLLRYAHFALMIFIILLILAILIFDLVHVFDLNMG